MKKSSRLRLKKSKSVPFFDYMSLNEHKDEGRAQTPEPSDSEVKKDRAYRRAHPYRQGERPREEKKRAREVVYDHEASLTFDIADRGAEQAEGGGMSSLEQVAQGLSIILQSLEAHEQKKLLFILKQLFNIDQPYPDKFVAVEQLINHNLIIIKQLERLSGREKAAKLKELRHLVSLLTQYMETFYKNQDLLQAGSPTHCRLRSMHRFIEELAGSPDLQMISPHETQLARPFYEQNMAHEVKVINEKDPDYLPLVVQRKEDAQEIASLKTQVFQLKQDNQALEQTVKVLTEEKQSLQIELSEYRKWLKEAREEAKRESKQFKSMLVQTQNELKQSKHRNKELEEKVEKYHSQIEDNHRTNQAMQQKLKLSELRNRKTVENFELKFRSMQADIALLMSDRSRSLAKQEKSKEDSQDQLGSISSPRFGFQSTHLSEHSETREEEMPLKGSKEKEESQQKTPRH